MVLSEQETRCIHLVCQHLGQSYPGDWRLPDGPTLDELHPDTPSPEVVVTNGRRTCAIEVKRLTGGAEFQAYTESFWSLERSLAPSCGGYYFLEPPVNIHLPLDRKLVRLVRKEIERVAPQLDVDQQPAPILIPREGHISVGRPDGSYIHCLHTAARELLTPVLDRVSGHFFLIDEGLEHSFHTTEGREQFAEAVAKACMAGLEGDHSPFGWYEEWNLTKLDNDTPGGVQFMAVTAAVDMRLSVAECVLGVVDNGLGKFKGKTWADLHALVLECSISAPRQLVADVIGELESEELQDVHLILLIDGDAVYEAFSRPMSEPGV